MRRNYSEVRQASMFPAPRADAGQEAAQLILLVDCEIPHQDAFHLAQRPARRGQECSSVLRGDDMANAPVLGVRTTFDQPIALESVDHVGQGRLVDPETVRQCEKLFSSDEMLDDIMLYGLPNSAASAARPYWGANRAGWATPGTLEQPISVPTGLSIMPGEYVRRSRRWAEKRYTDLAFFNEVARGGHFALLEQPTLLVHDIRATFRGL